MSTDLRFWVTNKSVVKVIGTSVGMHADRVWIEGLRPLLWDVRKLGCHLCEPSEQLECRPSY